MNFTSQCEAIVEDPFITWTKVIIPTAGVIQDCMSAGRVVGPKIVKLATMRNGMVSYRAEVAVIRVQCDSAFIDNFIPLLDEVYRKARPHAPFATGFTNLDGTINLPV